MKPLRILLLVALHLTSARGERIANDPAPPEVHPPSKPIAEAATFDRLTSHALPKPLPPDAVTDDWPHFLGANYDLTSKESGLVTTWKEGSEPILLWEVQRGKGFAPPVAARGRLLMAHRLDKVEILECLDAKTGKRFWFHETPIDFGQAFGYSEGPQAPPTIDGDRVYFIGTRALVQCFDLASGSVIWERDLGREMAVETDFFGKGGAPLIHGDLLILNLGGKNDYAVAAFEKMTGRLVWVTRQPWDGSYASPISATLHGRDRVLVFAGGKTIPPHGGLLCVDPADGALDFAFPWRATRPASVNASTPRVVGSRIFMSEAYTEGGVLLDVGADLKPTVFKALPKINVQFMTPLVREQRYLYGITEKNERSAVLFCLDLQSGEELWRTLNIGRGNLLATADGIFATGEFGQFMSLRLTPKGPEVLAEMRPFSAPETFAPPTIHRGLLYLIQSTPTPGGGAQPRILCYDLRK